MTVMATAGILAIVLVYPTTIHTVTGRRTAFYRHTIIRGTIIIIGIIPTLGIIQGTTIIHIMMTTVMATRTLTAPACVVVFEIMA